MLKRQHLKFCLLTNQLSSSFNKKPYLTAPPPMPPAIRSNPLTKPSPLEPRLRLFPFLRGGRNCLSVETKSELVRLKRGGWNSGLVLKGCCSDDDRGARTRAFVREYEARLEESGGFSASSRSVYGKWTARKPPAPPLGFPDFSLTEKIVVAVDVDEVLGSFLSALNRFIADRYSLNHSVSEYHVYEFFKVWNCSRDEAATRVHEFFKSPHFKSGIHPIPGARQTLFKLSRLCKFSVVTSRQNAIKDHTIEWIEQHYPGVFQEIHFGNHFALDGESRPKSEICRSLGAKVLIDDNPRYAIECAEDGMRVLLFDFENSYPWCKTDLVDQHPMVTKVHNWEEVERQLLFLSGFY